MPRLIDAEHLKKRATDWFGDCWDNYAQTTEDFLEYIDNEPTVDAEPTVEQVKEFCRKRCLVIVNSELFNEMKARWSAMPVKHGHWIVTPYGHMTCLSCGWLFEYYDGLEEEWNYCPHCGAKMDEAD